MVDAAVWWKAWWRLLEDIRVPVEDLLHVCRQANHRVGPVERVGGILSASWLDHREKGGVTFGEASL
jgi:hypothetical protein